MKAVRVHQVGGPEALRYEEAPDPAPGSGEALVRVAAAGVNFIDVYQRMGRYPLAMPFTVGQEASGTVAATGPGVTSVAVGDRVAYAGANGAYAQFAVVNAERLVPVPPSVDLDQAAAVMLQGMTAHYLTTSTYPLKSGDTCVVHAAAGGVGLLLCQLAKRLRARVIATVSTATKAELARGAGADDVIIYTERDFVPAVRQLVPRGVDVVYDSVGRTTFLGGFDCLRPRGMLVLFGQSSGPVELFDPQLLNRKGSLFLTRPTLGHYIETRAELLQRAGDVLDWVRTGALHARVGGRYTLAEAAQAHRDLEARRTTGKLLLIP
ncbi:MAG TPA: quinone oxidoreductase [Gemmatimonadales bacterium]|nr:quinone oxidoreductase [Gemmatimonadales bacterium]